MAEASPFGAPSGGPFARLEASLDRGRPVVAQTHDYPDIDAVASAWGLAELLARRGYAATSSYRGEIRSRSLARLVAELGIELVAAAGTSAGEAAAGLAQVVAIDGSPSNGNLSLLPGELVGVIDHHYGIPPEAPFRDLRPELASSSSIVYGYWVEAGEPPPRPIATALLAGIQSDTDFLSRRSSPGDFAAYTALFGLGDWQQASRIVRTVLDLRELGLIAQALSAAQAREGLLFAEVLGDCAQEVVAVTADFALRAEELRAAVVAERDADGVHLSVRSKDPGLSAFALVRRALEGIGTGGGHSHAAGGIVPPRDDPGMRKIRERFFAAAAEADARARSSGILT